VICGRVMGNNELTNDGLNTANQCAPLILLTAVYAACILHIAIGRLTNQTPLPIPLKLQDKSCFIFCV